MKFRVSQKFPMFIHQATLNHRHLHLISFVRKLQTSRASVNGGSSSSQGHHPHLHFFFPTLFCNSFLVPGATVATILMLGALHARRLYDDKKVEDAREKGLEFEFHPDVKATFLQLLPLRSISRYWGLLTSVDVPLNLLNNAEAFDFSVHDTPSLKSGPYALNYDQVCISDLEEAAMPLDEYATLRDFFVRSLKEGSRPIDPDPRCLVSPVDGIILRFGELKAAGAMIEQVKGFSYSVSSLLGANSLLPMITEENTHAESSELENTPKDQSNKSWWRVSLASPKVWDPVASSLETIIGYTLQLTGMFLFAGIFQVVLEGQWQEGFMGIAAIGATNIGSIELFIEPELRTNRPRKKFFHSEPPEERIYEPEGVGVMLKKGDEMAAFNMGSTVVLVFQAPVSRSPKNQGSSEFSFCTRKGDRIRVGEALGRWHDS
ncbi:Phosphatidylserine decarboxylase proenzyme 1, mitochondrial [Vitis vinifera]|uniref:phosphatidylserine decarboxylase n=1 Tax=Vitis vinifera TaxID=29760 RepID=A0A438K2C2_VITVI|nr:Phosphatidylserine decarboxylase proenzyme 1, mitochondrial [Vitis vinifera]